MAYVHHKASRSSNPRATSWLPHTQALILPLCRALMRSIPVSFTPDAHEKNQNIKKQNAMNDPIIIPSLLFLAEILVIRVLIPGT